MPEPITGSEQRLERRNNLFVVAALDWPGTAAAAPVRIRNLSPSGAMIEGARLPDVGTSVRLSRGQQSVAGELMWRVETHAGLQFSAPVEVADWLPASARSAGQQRVDRIVFETKAAGVATGILRRLRVLRTMPRLPTLLPGPGTNSSPFPGWPKAIPTLFRRSTSRRRRSTC